VAAGWRSCLAEAARGAKVGVRRKKSALVVPLGDDERRELERILVQGDERAALAFVERHLKPAAHAVLNGG